jgi:hypothetical protein
MKVRLQNWVTTIIGAILMASAIAMYIISKFNLTFEISILEVVSIAVLGWVFVTARDTLLEGVFLNIFKIKK